MKYDFGARSLANLKTCEARLQQLAWDALEASPCDFSIFCGHRNQEAQDRAFEMGRSRLQWPNGKHNRLPSRALDFGAYPFPWDESPKRRARYYLIAGVFFGRAQALGLRIRWGGDWDGDGDLTDQTFDDLGHIELLGEGG